MTTTKTTLLVTSVLEEALFTRRRASVEFTGSIGSLGDALDNALMEPTIGLYKTELITRHPRSWTGRGDVECETAA